MSFGNLLIDLISSCLSIFKRTPPPSLIIEEEKSTTKTTLFPLAVPPKKVEVPPPPSPSPIPEPKPLPKSVPIPRGSTTGSSNAGTEIEDVVVAEIGLILAAL